MNGYKNISETAVFGAGSRTKALMAWYGARAFSKNSLRVLNFYRMFKIESKQKDIAVFGAGCFWCTEAVFQNLNGVSVVLPGYTGGDLQNPSYEQVSSGSSGHVEAAKIEFDPAIISFKQLLEVFLRCTTRPL